MITNGSLFCISIKNCFIWLIGWNVAGAHGAWNEAHIVNFNVRVTTLFGAGVSLSLLGFLAPVTLMKEWSASSEDTMVVLALSVINLR